MPYNRDKYITTIYSDPYEYYWEQINDSISAIPTKEKQKKIYIDNFKTMLAEAAAEMKVNVRDKKMLTQLCYKACQAILFEIVFSTGKPPHVAYALEYFEYAPTIFDLGDNPRVVNWDDKSYYHKLVKRLWDTLNKECNSSILNNIHSKSFNNVLDLEQLRADLKRVVARFYTYNPELRESTDHILELQHQVTTIFSTISREFDKKAKSEFENTQRF